MTSGAGPLQYASHSRVLGCVPLDCVSQCAIDSFVQPQSVVQTQTGHPSAGLQSSSSMLRCEPVGVPGQFSDTDTRDNPR